MTQDFFETLTIFLFLYSTHKNIKWTNHPCHKYNILYAIQYTLYIYYEDICLGILYNVCTIHKLYVQYV